MGHRVEVRREVGRLIVRRHPDAKLVWGCLGPLSFFLWLFLALISGIASRGHPVILASLGVLGAGFLLGLFSFARAAWRVEATPEVVGFVKEGLLGERRRSWPAWDVASFWAAEISEGEASSWRLRIGFGNGDSRTLGEGSRDEILDMAEILRQERPKAPLPRGEAPPRPEPSDAVPKGVHLVRWGPRFRVELAEGVVEIGPEALDIPGAGRWRTSDIDHIQTYSDGGIWELQVLLKDRSKARVLRGRPAGELDWLARFLRLAMRGKEELQKLHVDPNKGICQVCGEGMSSRIVTCARCRTPHHAECWTYVGQCSTYACREIRCLG